MPILRWTPSQIPDLTNAIRDYKVLKKPNNITVKQLRQADYLTIVILPENPNTRVNSSD